MAMRFWLTLACAAVSCGSAMAQDAATPTQACTPAVVPEVERPEKPQRPPLPNCVNEARGTHTCRAGVIRDYEAASQAYEAAFQAYVADVNGYLRRLETYMNEAVQYADCERRIVMPSSLITG